jgi:hypothetical protein
LPATSCRLLSFYVCAMTDEETTQALTPEHLAMLASYAQLAPVLDAITGKPLPQSLRERFSEVREHLAPGRQPPPEVASTLPGVKLAGPLPERPQRRLLESLGYVEEALAAAEYHRQRVEELEGNISRIVKEAFKGMTVPPSGTIGFRVPILGFEYHAFLFSLRRALDYLAVGVAAAFGRECHSIRRLGRSVKNAEPSDRATAVANAVEVALPSLKSIVSESDERSVRDRLAHWQIVDAGYFNARLDENGEVAIELVGGGEDLPAFTGIDSENAPLATALETLMSAAVALVFKLVDESLPPGQAREVAS